MPRGQPKSGFRMTKNRINAGGRDMLAKFTPVHIITHSINTLQEAVFETDDQIDLKLKERFKLLEMLVDQSIKGKSRALIVSGPPGLGKSFTVEEKLKDSETKHSIIKGFVGLTGIYKLLYAHKNKGDVLVFDDADSVFDDLESLNMLKAVCDTTEQRVVGYRKEINFIDDETGEVIPREFCFCGTIIFITNLDFDMMIAKNHRLTPHFNALMSRAHYVDLAMKSKRDYIIRIKQVVKQGMLRNIGLNEHEVHDVLVFIEDNKDRLRELSLRMAIKIGGIVSMGHDWRRVAEVTCCRNQ